MTTPLRSDDDVVIASAEPQYYGSLASGITQATDTTGDIIFRTAGVERARIKADGTGTGWPNVLGGSIAASVGVLASGDTTGAADVTTIQAAIDSLKGVGGVVQLKGTQFYVNATLITYPGITLAGVGPLGVSQPVYGTSVITGVAALNAPIIQVQLDPGNTNWASFPVLRDFTINGVSTNASQDGIYVTDTAGQVLDTYIYNVSVFSVGGNGLNLSSQNNKVWVDKCYFEHCFQNGIRNANATLRVTQSYIFGNTLYGIDATSAAYLMVAHCLFGNNGQSGTASAAGAIKIGSSGSGGSITSNDFFDNGTSAGQAIRLTTQTGTGRWIIASNNFKDTRAGSAVPNFVLCSDSGASNAIVATNMFVGQTGKAVLVKFNNASEAVQIRGNHGYNPYGSITNPINTTNNSIGVGAGTTSTAVASTDYTIRELDQYLVVSGGTGVSITIKDPAGTTVESGLTSYAKTLPIGFKINFGAFSVAPTVASFGN